MKNLIGQKIRVRKSCVAVTKQEGLFVLIEFENGKNIVLDSTKFTRKNLRPKNKKE